MIAWLLISAMQTEPLRPEMCDVLLANIKDSQSVSEEQKLSVWLECRMKAAQEQEMAERQREEELECLSKGC